MPKVTVPKAFNRLDRGYPRHARRDATVRKVRDLLRAEVLATCAPGAALPSESELELQFGVSRGVVRESLDLLRQEGLIARLQGAGTFAVTPTRSAHGIDQLRKVTDEVDRGTARVTWKLVDLDVTPAPRFLAAKLRIPPGTPVVSLERLMILDGGPIGLNLSWFPESPGRLLLDRISDLYRPMYDIIEDVLGQVIAEVSLQLEPTTADPVTAPLLQVEVGTALQLVERSIDDDRGVPILYSLGRSRGDRFVNRTVLQIRRPCAPDANQSATIPLGCDTDSERVDLPPI